MGKENKITNFPTLPQCGLRRAEPTTMNAKGETITPVKCDYLNCGRRPGGYTGTVHGEVRMIDDAGNPRIGFNNSVEGREVAKMNGDQAIEQHKCR